MKEVRILLSLSSATWVLCVDMGDFALNGQ